MRPILLLLLLVLSIGSSASAQIIGPGPKQGKLQIGGWWAFTTYDSHSEMTLDERRYSWNDEPVKTDRAGLVIRYGVSDDAYAILNFGMIQKTFEYRRSPDFDEYKFVWNALEGVLGIGGNIRFLRYKGTSLRLGGHYNDVFVMETDGEYPPWRSRDARIALHNDYTVSRKSVSLTMAVGALVFSSRQKFYWSYYQGVIRSHNKAYVGPVAAAMVTFWSRVNLGLELTFGAITDFRWRTEIQL